MKQLLLLTILNFFSFQVIAQEKVLVFTNPSEVGFGLNKSISNLLVAVTTGPLHGSDGLPVGGYRDHAGTRKPFTHPNSSDGNFGYSANGRSFNGVFGVTADGKPILKRYEGYHSIKEWEDIQWKWCFQNGMILLENTMNYHNASSMNLLLRAGIGYKYTYDGPQLVYIYSGDAVTFYEFAEMFKKHGCESAIYLDGWGGSISSNPLVGYVSKSYGSGGQLRNDVIVLQFFNQ